MTTHNFVGSLGTDARSISLAERNLLVIDDDADFAATIQDLMEFQDCHVATATGATDVESIPSHFIVEIVLLDVRLKDTSGIDLMSYLHARWPYARIIIMTGYSSKEIAVQALKSGAVGYLEKPINPDELTATMLHALWAHDAEIAVNKAHEQLQLSLLDAKAANRSKSVFLANMSHELRTPLNAIIGFSEMMKSECLGPLSADRYMEYVDDILQSGNHILSLINDLLDLSRIELNAQTIELEQVSLSAVVNDAVVMVRESAQRRNITLERTAPDEHLCVDADRRMVTQMLINLIGNAVKFANDGGRVVIATSRNDAGEHIISVEDDGVGISKDMIKKVCEPFVFAEPVESRSRGGVGLGLSITKQLIEHHGGRLELTSQEGVGTIATLVFPAKDLGSESAELGNEGMAG